MMTLGMASIGFGIALFLTGGVPGLWHAAGIRQGIGLRPVAGHSAPIFVTVALIVFLYVLLSWTRLEPLSLPSAAI